MNNVKVKICGITNCSDAINAKGILATVKECVEFRREGIVKELKKIGMTDVE
jgi:phosphoribosylanthranilate isomerase